MNDDHAVDLAGDAIPSIELEQARALIAANEWVFAKTMPDSPHFYTLRKRWTAKEDFAWLVLFVRKYGVSQKYGRYSYVYFVDDGWKYWSMGAPVGETILINRARLANVVGEVEGRQ